MMPGERKSVEPMAAMTAPARTAAQHQSLLHFVGKGGGPTRECWPKFAQMVLPQIERHGPIEAWIIDDTGFPKEGTAFGWGGTPILRAARQAGQLPGRRVAVDRQPPRQPAGGLSAVSAERLGGGSHADLRKVGVPEEIDFKTKPEIALEQIRWACEAGLPGEMVLLDAGYGHDSKLRAGITELGKVYVAGIQPQTLVWAPGKRPGGAPKKGHRRAPDAISAKQVALDCCRRVAHDRVAARHQ